MRFVLDASAVLEGEPDPDAEYLTVQGVVDELRSEEARFALERLRVTVREPGKDSLRRAREGARGTGDVHRLSPTDLSLIALALESGAPIVTNDFSIQNACRALGVAYLSPRDEIASEFRWVVRCEDCGKYLESAGTCPVCGGRARVRRDRRVRGRARRPATGPAGTSSSP